MAAAVRTNLPGTLGGGLVLWLSGYALAMVLFAFVPVALIGWFVLPVLLPFTAIVAYKRLRNLVAPFTYYLLVAAMWLAMAAVLDYVFIVRAFDVAGYYDSDVGIYYLATFSAPLFFGWARARQTSHARHSVGQDLTGAHQ